MSGVIYNLLFVETSEKLEIKIDLQKQIQNFKKLVINQLLKSCSRYVL